MSNTAPTNNLLQRIEARKQELAKEPAAEPTKALSLKERIALRAAQAATQVSIANPQPTVESEMQKAVDAAKALGIVDVTQVPAPTDVSQTAFAPPPPMPASDQPINCPSDFQPATATVEEQKAAETKELETFAPEATTKSKGGRPKGSKNAAPALGGIDVAALNEFLKYGAKYFKQQLGLPPDAE